MDREFSTTFIPKKTLDQAPGPVVRRPSAPLGFLPIVAGLFFVAALSVAGGTFVWERTVATRISAMSESLERSEKNFEPSLIVELQRLDARLRVANNLLQNHLAITPLFRVLEDITLKKIQYDEFDYSIDGTIAQVSVEGRSQGYNPIAQQSLLFGEHPFISEHVFSDMELNEQGLTAFHLEMILDNKMIRYQNTFDNPPVAPRSINNPGTTNL